MLYRKHRSTFDAIKDPNVRAARMCEINVQMQVRRVAAIPTVDNAWARGRSLHVHGWVYGMHDGLLRDIGPTLSGIADRDAPPRVDDCVVNQTSPLSALQIQALETFCDPALNRDGRHAQRSTAAATCGLARRITAVYDLDRF